MATGGLLEGRRSKVAAATRGRRPVARRPLLLRVVVSDVGQHVLRARHHGVPQSAAEHRVTQRGTVPATRHAIRQGLKSRRAVCVPYKGREQRMVVGSGGRRRRRPRRTGHVTTPTTTSSLAISLALATAAQHALIHPGPSLTHPSRFQENTPCPEPSGARRGLGSRGLRGATRGCHEGVRGRGGAVSDQISRR